ncbi:hypothetical protein [Niabella ginsengisoli]|uniref:Uncharacterized protein n=1 Tax=Niabella ginsengisoli TaxID=522298 RepID=A0ABS9SE87_9BACT|nr:hypothetical protein [Niabella ginsengisoli]MCH5596670.1 hypothetical protein [Niabella ginsengisoli]
MRKLRILQTITIGTFMSLIGLFVAYRGGFLDSLIFRNANNLQTSPNGAPVTGTKTTQKDSVNITRISSSKSIVVVDKNQWPKADSVKKLRMSSSKSLILTERKWTAPLKNAENSRLSSSKSAIIFKPSDTAKRKN